MPRQVSEQDWSDLLTSIELNECILILGPNITMPSDSGGTPEPLTRQFARQLAQMLPADKINDPANLSHVTEVYIRETNNITRFKGLLQAFYKRDREVPEVLEQLTHLPFRLIINAAPDDLLHKAYLKRHIHFNSMFYDFDHSGEQPDPQYDNQDPTPFIYNLFGSYTNPGSVVLTESQQVEFVQQIIQKEHKIPNSIQAVFRESKNYLFLGFDFSDWYLRLLISALNPKEEAKIPVSFALQSETAPLPGTTEVFFGQRFKIGFFDSGVDGFCAGLRQRWDQKNAGTAAPASPKSAPGGTGALVLHAVEDTKWRDQFVKNAAALPKDRRLDMGEIAPGDNIADKLRELMESAAVVIPLISAGFVAEYYELWEQQLLPLHREGKVTVVPVLAEATLWESLPEIESMPVLPRNKKPLGSWDDDMPEAWRHIMTELSTILQNL